MLKVHANFGYYVRPHDKDVVLSIPHPLLDAKRTMILSTWM